MNHDGNARRVAAAVLLAWVLSACERPSADEPRAAPAAPAAQPAAGSPDTGAATAAATDEAVDAQAGDDAATPVAERALRDSYTRCLEAAGGVDSAMQACIGDEYEYQDGRLNTAYAGLKRTLAEAEMARLRDAQRQWLRDRDGECVWDAATEGSAQRLQANQCRLDATAARAAELEAMR